MLRQASCQALSCSIALWTITAHTVLQNVLACSAPKGLSHSTAAGHSICHASAGLAFGRHVRRLSVVVITRVTTATCPPDLRPCGPPAGHTALDYPKLFGYTVPVDKSVAAAMGSVIALLCVAIVGLGVGWRLAVTRSRKSYKKWGEEVGCRPLLS